MTRSDFVPRRAASAITDALGDTRVVLVNGARQAGKSTRVRAVAGQRVAEWRDLNLPQTGSQHFRIPSDSSPSPA